LSQHGWPKDRDLLDAQDLKIILLENCSPNESAEYCLTNLGFDFCSDVQKSVLMSFQACRFVRSRN
jgi:hypothetical protein